MPPHEHGPQSRVSGATRSENVVARMLEDIGREEDERLATERLHSRVDRRIAVAAEREASVIVGYRENLGLER